MSDANIILHAIQSALNAAIATAVAEATRPLVNRIDELETTLMHRITALENNPAIGTDTVLAERVKALEERPVGDIDASQVVVALNSKEWFWDKIRRFVDAGAEQALDNHLETYDHDSYDDVVNSWGGEDPTDFVKDDDIESQINDALRSASFEVRVTI